MRKLVKLSLCALVIVVLTRATCRTAPPRVTPVQRVAFIDNVRHHNMGIAWDGEYYYTVNGGNPEHSDLNRYDAFGNLDEGYDLGVDGRAILYSPVEEELYVKPHGRSLEEVDLDYEMTDVVTEFEDAFAAEQSSVAMAPDGERVYELDDGRVRIYEADGGEEETSFKLSSFSQTEELGYAYAIAASEKFLFVWAPNSDTDILVYGLDGKYVTKFALPRSGYGFSLSWANDMLWIAEDANGNSDGADGTWYGYELRGLE